MAKFNILIFAFSKHLIFFLFIFTLCLVVQFFLYPSLLFQGYPTTSHDAKWHLSWYSYFSEQFFTGNFYPRWLVKENDNYGSPVFYYYQPLSYWLTCIINLFLNGDPSKLLGISSFIAGAFSGLSFFYATDHIKHFYARFSTSVLYMGMPFHLIIDLTQRGAFAEYWAFVFIPFLFLSLKKNNYSLVSIAFTLLIYTHIPTALVASVFLLFYILHLTTIKMLLPVKLIIALFIGILLSCPFLLPSIFYQKYINVAEMNLSGQLFKTRFLLSYTFPFLTQIEFDRTILNYFLIELLIFLFLFLRFFSNLNNYIKFIFTYFLITALFTTQFSTIFYNLFFYLQFIQFPWRFLSVGTFFWVIFISNVLLINKFCLERLIYYCIIVLYILTINILNSCNRHDVIPFKLFLPTYSPPEYKTLWQTSDALSGSEGLLIINSFGSIIKGTNHESNNVVTVNKLYFPFLVIFNGDNKVVQTFPNKYGLLSFIEPIGTYRISLKTTRGPVEKFGYLLFFIGFTLLFAETKLILPTKYLK